ncbi:hypothetical protein A1OQ_13530 [Enterovibrio norvegicus FF-162]|uniref:hypothetical protein n=1 Tax=Enterovibrio norvegicus TaxID=188144 RepID=UPI0002FBB328|nr:hypothetical protein [Enterovibrio norvegicus]OEE88355.1 hypothetical protein A1OQ_13530 [Enterovibrio norvegicus FF-162]
MSIVRQILEPFGKVTKLSIKDNFCLYEAKYTFLSSAPLDRLKETLEIHLTRLNQSGVSVVITVYDNNPIRISSDNLGSLDEKVGLIVDELVYLEGDVDIEIRIDKEESVNLNIFDLSVFVEHIDSLSLQENLEAWSKFDLSTPFSVDVWEDAEPFTTESICFNSVFPNVNGKSDAITSESCKLDKLGKVEKRDKCGHFANAAQFNFIPNDFKVCCDKNKQLKNYFNGLFNSFLIVYLSDFSSISGDTIKYRLKGYKLLSGSVDFSDLMEHDSSELSRIYEWTYLEGNYTDKIGLARNIISIHLNGECILSIECGTSDSVKSGYDLYLKDNVKQYIEIKNKISDFLQSQSDKALDMTKSMFSMFKTGLWTFTTFFITVFLLRVVNKGTLSGVFGFEVYVVSLLLIVISFIYLLISVMEINSDRNRLIEKYSDIRGRYKDLLDKADLDKIIDVETVSLKERLYINKKRNRYILMWIITNLVILIAVSILYCSSAGSNVERDIETEKVNNLNGLEVFTSKIPQEDEVIVTSQEHDVRVESKLEGQESKPLTEVSSASGLDLKSK